MLEWYGGGGIHFESPAPPLPSFCSRVLGALSSPAGMDHGKWPLEESLEAGGSPPCCLLAMCVPRAASHMPCLMGLSAPLVL